MENIVRPYLAEDTLDMMKQLKENQEKYVDLKSLIEQVKLYDEGRDQKELYMPAPVQLLLWYCENVAAIISIGVLDIAFSFEFIPKIGLTALGSVDLFLLMRLAISRILGNIKEKNALRELGILMGEQLENIEDLELLEKLLDIRLDSKLCKDLTSSIQKNISQLLSDDYVGLCVENVNDRSKVATALEKEWEAYLEEINNMPISDMHLGGYSLADECYTQELNVEPKKLENKPQH